MSEVQRYDCGTEYDGGVMNEVPDGEYVEFKDYAALEAERDTLAAENAALKARAPCERTIGYLSELIGKLASMDYHPLRPVDYRISDVNEWLRNYHNNKVPATDAYANQLRAEGVEMLARGISRDRCHDRESQMEMGEVLDFAIEFAANLRKDGE